LLRHIAGKNFTTIGDNGNARIFRRINAFDNRRDLWKRPGAGDDASGAIEPGPIPIFTVSTPASINATFRQLPRFRRYRVREFMLDLFDGFDDARRNSCAVSTTIASARELINAAARSKIACRTDWPPRRAICPLCSIANRFFFLMSLTVIKPLRSPWSSTTKFFDAVFLQLHFARASSDWDGDERLLHYHASETEFQIGFQKRKSRLVIRRRVTAAVNDGDVPADSETPHHFQRFETSALSRIVTGSTIIPLSERFTTSSACSSMEKFCELRRCRPAGQAR